MEPRGELRDDLRSGLMAFQIISAVRAVAGATKGAPLRFRDFTLPAFLSAPAMTPAEAAQFHERFLQEHATKQPKK